MKDEIIKKLKESLADKQHDIWSHWMKYMFTQCDIERDAFGDIVSCSIPAEKVERWMRQMNTGYDDLTDKEKESDRNQVDKFMHLIMEAMLVYASGKPS